MNTYFDYLAVAFLFLFPWALAVVAFRMIRRDAIAAYRVYKWGTYDSGWQYDGGVAQMHKIHWSWPAGSFSPRFFLPGQDGKQVLQVVDTNDFEPKDTWKHNGQKWTVDGTDYLIVCHYLAWDKTWIVAWSWILLTGLIVSAYMAQIPARTNDQTPVPTAEYATPIPTPTGPTMAPYPTFTPEPEVTQPQDADVLVIDLNREASPSEIWEWLNSNLAAIPVPDLPINWQPPEWLVKLFGEPVTVIRLPEGIPGYVVVTYTEAGLKFIRTDDEFRMVGTPQFVFDNEATLQAGKLHWGIEFDVDHYAWERPTSGYKGNTLLIVFESVYDPTFSVRGRGLPYNWGYAPIFGVAVILLIVLAIYWWRNRY